jgi:hypothetical protein
VPCGVLCLVEIVLYGVPAVVADVSGFYFSAGRLWCRSCWWCVLGTVPGSPSCLSCAGRRNHRVTPTNDRTRLHKMHDSTQCRTTV